MLELVATGPEAGQRWRQPLPEAQPVRLGRSPRAGWAVPWDLRISREHADVLRSGGSVRVRCLDTALNPAYFRDAPLREFTAHEGDAFRIGVTTFHLEKAAVSGISDSDEPVVEFAYRHDEVARFDFRNADQRLETLWNLPKVIAGSRNEEEFAQSLVGLILDGVPRADAAAVVQFDLREGGDPSKPLMMRLDSRAEGTVRLKPSRRLMLKALQRGETLLHLWSEAADDEGSKYTISGNFDWAFCTPLTERSSRGWCLYVCGKLGEELRGPDDLAGDLRFTQYIAEVTGAIRQMRALEAQQAGLRKFFSPKVIKTLAQGDPEAVLAPRECEVTALFCDLRGFSRKAEQSRHELHELLQRCSDALGIMSKAILDEDGVIADFQGDAALGFWGWPLPEGALPACRAALAIQAEFRRAQQQPGHPLADFQVGIGIAHGRAIAGRIGTSDQSKVGCFGPVVNLASRLEGLTKQVGVPILLDEAATAQARRGLPSSTARLRPLGRVIPYGMDTPVAIAELLPPETEDPVVNASTMAEFDAAVRAFSSGAWAEAVAALERVPDPDRAKQFLLASIARELDTPTTPWQGAIRLEAK